MKKLKLFFACLLMAVLSIGQVWAAENDTHDFEQSVSELLNNCNVPDDIVIAEQSYSVKEVIITYSYNKSAPATASVQIGSTAFGTSVSLVSAQTSASFSGDALKGAITISFEANSGCDGTKKGTLGITNVRLVEGPASGGDPVDPTITFNNGSVDAGYTLNLSTLFTSNSTGAVTYSITEGDSYASIDGSILTGVAAGSVTVQASQAATASYNAATANSTITVNAHTVTPGTYDIIFANAFWGTSGTGSNAGHTASGIQNDISVSINGNSGTQNYINDTETRIYGSHTLTFSVPTGYVLTEITGLGTADKSSISVASGSTGSIATRVWTGSANSVTFDIGGRTDFSTVNVTYDAESGDVIVKTLKSIEVTGMTTSYEVGDAFSFDGTCTATYSVTKNGDPQPDEDKEVTPTSVTDPDMTSTGDKIITVTYEENEVSKSTTYNITVAEAPSKSTLDFEEKYATGGATADDGAVWTVTSDGTESQFDNTSGIHYGTNSAEVTYLQLATSDISGTISKVVVNARDAQANATITVTVGGVAFTCTGSATATNTSTNYTFTGSGSGEIVVRVERTESMTKAIYVKTIVVSYEADASAPAVTIDPTAITLATPDAANGTIDATYTNVTLASVAVGRYNDEECSEAFTGDWLTATLNDDKDIEYEVASNTGEARTAYIKLTAPASNGTSPDIVKVIQVTQAKAIPIYTSLDALFAAAISTDQVVKIEFDDCVITGKKEDNKTAYLTDKNNTYGLVIFTSGHGFKVGDVLNGTVQTTLCKFNGNSELKGLTSTTDGLSVVAGSPISTPRVVADPTTLSGANTGSVIKVTGSCTKETKSEKDYYYVNGVQLYNALSEYTTPTVGDQYHCTGVFLMYNAIKEIMPREASELEHIDVPTAVITFEDFNIENGQNTTLAATVAPAVAASAKVTYSIVDGGEYVSLADDVLTANEIGIAHIRATVADNLPNYYGATKDITVTVTAPDSRKTAVIDGITAVSGTLVTETAGAHKDKEYISYVAQKGDASSAPIIPSGKSFVRIYQNGGYLAINAVKGCLIDEVIVSIPSTCNPTTIAVGTDEENLPTTGGTSATAGNNFSTGTGLNSQNVYLVCLGTDKDHRLEVGAITVKYNGDPISVKSIALSGTYQTEFTKNATFNHDGVVVTATYTDDSQADVTTLAEFSEPDMSTLGQKEITVSYGGKSTSYNIEVVAATLTEIAISGTYPTRFNVGDEFSHAGMTVTATYSDYSEEDVTGDATFSGYDMFVGGVQTVTVEYGGQSAKYSIIVVPANTDVITAADLEATSTQYKPFSGVKELGTSAVFAGENAKSEEGAIQLRTKNSTEGIVVTTGNDGKIVKSITIAYQTTPTERTLQVYGKHTAYVSAASLYSSDASAQGTLIGEIAVSGSLNCAATEEYEYIGLRSSDGAIYIATIMIEWADATPAQKYSVTYAANGGGGDAPTAVEYEEGETFTVAAANLFTAPEGKEFDKWNDGTNDYAPGDTYIVGTADVVLTAIWKDAAPAPVYETVRTGLDINRFYTVCLPKKVIAIKGASFWTLNNKSQDGATAYLEEETNNLPFAAGKPFIIQATADKLEVVYEGEATETPGVNGAIHGTLTYMDAAALAAAGSNVYMLYNNELRPVGENNHLDANRAYVKVDELNPVSSVPQGAPGKRVVAMPMQKDQAQGFENLDASEKPLKVMIDGTLYILRGEKVYDATGRLVK